MKIIDFKIYALPESDRYIFLVKKCNIITHIDFHQGYNITEENEIINMFLERANEKNKIIGIYNNLMRLDKNPYINNFKSLKTIDKINQCIELYILTNLI